MIEPRRSVRGLDAYSPPLEGRRDLIRLDFNENTKCNPGLLPGLPAGSVSAYPEYGELTDQLAKHWSVPVDHLLLTNGSDEGLSVVATTFIEPNEATAVICRPAFALIAHYLSIAGARLNEIPMTTALDFDCEQIETALDLKPQLALFASPDNPTGAALPEATVQRWCERYPETLFVIDEAYAEYAEATVLPLVTSFSNLIVLRSFSKAWGMAGLRLGALLGAPRLIEYMRRVRSPYSVNTAAVFAALQLLKRSDEILVSARDTMVRKRGLVDQVRQRGYRVHDGAANFFLIRVGYDVTGWCQFFRDNGILVRDRSRMPALEGMVRVSVGTDSENQSFLATLDAFRDKHALIFDLDDTLVDTTRSYNRVVAELVTRYSDTALRPNELNELRGEGGFNDDWESAAELLRRRGVTFSSSELAQVGRRLYLSLASQNEEWLLSDDLLDRLRKRFRLFVLTGRPRAKYAPVWGEYADARFEKVFCRDDFGDIPLKPAPDTLLAALRDIGLSNGLYVGNSVDDMRAASDAGLGRVGVTNGSDPASLQQAGAEHLIRSITDIRKVFQL